MPGREREYHEATDFTRTSFGGGGMFRSPRPELFKPYKDLERIDLPEPDMLPNGPYAEIAASAGGAIRKLDITGLTRLLACSHIITATASTGSGKFYFRNVPSAGALYPAELYLASSGIEGLGDGIYHHQILRWELARLRAGNFAAAMADILTEDEPPGLIFIISAVFGRSAWKYGNRAYRYCCLDAGHLAESVVLSARALGLVAHVSFIKNPKSTNDLICADGESEAALCAVNVWVEPDIRGKSGECSKPEDNTEKMAPRAQINSTILAAYQASWGKGGVADFRVELLDLGLRDGPESVFPPSSAHETKGFAETVYKRRSERRFSDAIDQEKTAAMLSMICGVPDDASRIGLICAHAGGFADGFYLLDLVQGTTRLIREGDFISKLAAACLGQSFMARASLSFIMFTDLNALDSRFGDGGYLRALIEAGRQGQRAYLAATALGLSACGIGAFFDYEVRDLLGLADSSRALYVVVSG